MTSLWYLAYSIDVSLLELRILPCTCTEHFCGELSLQLCTLWLVICTLSDIVRLLANDSNKFALLELIDHFLVVTLYSWGLNELIQLSLVLIVKIFSDTHDFFLLFASNFDPLVLHCLGESNLGNLCTNLLFNFSFQNFSANLEG